MNTGFYWVKFRDQWTVAHYNSEPDRWEIVGSDVSVKTNELQEVNESKVNIKEPKEELEVKKQEPTKITITIEVKGGSVEIVK